MANPRLEYDQRLAQRRRRAEKWLRRRLWIRNARLFVFILGVLTLAWVLRSEAPHYWLAVPAVGFIALVFAHEWATRALRRSMRSVEFYLRGIDRIRCVFAGKGRSGEAYLDGAHPYATHLDIFGAGSLYELLCQAQSRGAEDLMADWLRAPAAPATLRARQVAVAELREKLDLREELAVIGPDVREGTHPDALVRWGGADRQVVTEQTRGIALALSITTVVAALAGMAGITGPIPFVLSVLIEIGFWMRWRLYVRGVLSDLDRTAQELELWSALLERLEREPFDAPHLVALRAKLDTDGLAPSVQIARLRRRVNLLDARRNQLFTLVAPFLLWTTQLAFSLEAWRRQCGPALRDWLEAAAEIEVLADLGTYAYEHPDDPFPEILDQGAFVRADGLGHPLIPESECVRNDLRLDGDTALYVISGSNMSGKSTWLRTIGTNVVLALAGAPVRARRMSLAPVAIGASIRILDSLRDGSSRFYAEINCLRRIVELTDRELPVLFLLDEILAGTNSHDRGVGAAAVVSGLVERGAIGLMTTHDLALASVADDLGPRARNVHFEDQLIDGAMSFDYQLREGVVKKSNALELMRAVGLRV